MRRERNGDSSARTELHLIFFFFSRNTTLSPTHLYLHYGDRTGMVNQEDLARENLSPSAGRARKIIIADSFFLLLLSPRDCLPSA